MTVLILFGAVFLSLALMLAWVVQRRTRNSGWIDVTWTFAVGIAGVGYALAPVGPSPTWRQFLAAVLVAAWSLRLGLHIAGRSARATDDPRYAKLQQEWGEAAPRRLFWFLQVQAACALPLAISVLLAARNPVDAFRWQDGLGVLLVVAGIIGEAVADRQLRDFGRDKSNRGRICDVGLWSWSRHPNYFFEFLGWLGYPLLAISAVYPWGWLAFSGAVVIYVLLVHLSGIPPLEEHMLRSRGDAFRAYQARTNAFFPAPPRNEAA